MHAEATIPQVRFKKKIAGWNDEILPLRKKSSGIDFGREVAVSQARVKSWYRYAVRRVLRSQNKLRCNKLADVLLEDKLLA